MMLLLRESDKPKSLGEKIAEYLSRPPQPILRFFGDFQKEAGDGKQHLLFAVRNGLPLPLIYGLYIEARYYSGTDYIEKTDHIGPFSIDNWRLTIDRVEPAEIGIRVGIIPFEIQTDKAQVVV